MTATPVGTHIPSSPMPRPLTRWGISPDGDLVYRTLVQFGPAGEAALAQTLGLSRHRVRDALDELGHLNGARQGTAHAGGNAALRREDGRAWHANPPAELEAQLRQRHAKMLRNRYLLRRRLLGLRELGLSNAADTTGEHARVVFGLHNIRGRIAELVAQVRGEFLSATPEPIFDPATIRAAGPLDHAMIDNGVRVLNLAVPAEPAEDLTLEHREQIVLRGMAYRELDDVPAKLMIFDRSLALLPLVPGSGSRGALLLTDPDTVHELATMFLRWWDGARSLGTSTAGLSPREAAIVRLLAGGHTDASASAELGLSMRTIAYAIRELMNRYQAENRFQLGLALGARGVSPETAAGLCNPAADPARRS